VPRAVREQEMLNVAEAAFAERGYEAVSMQDIAGRCGISKPMVYAYFGSKEGIYLACIERARRDLYDAVVRAVAGAARADERMWLGTLAFFDWVDANRDPYRVLYGPGSVHGEAIAAALAGLRADQAALIERLLAESVPDADPADLEPLAHALVGAAESLAAWWIASGEGEPAERAVRRFMNLCWMGLGALRDGRTWDGAATPPG
jgi:AcrR family transcriptional regulator